MKKEDLINEIKLYTSNIDNIDRLFDIHDIKKCPTFNYLFSSNDLLNIDSQIRKKHNTGDFVALIAQNIPVDRHSKINYYAIFYEHCVLFPNGLIEYCDLIAAGDYSYFHSWKKNNNKILNQMDVVYGKDHLLSGNEMLLTDKISDKSIQKAEIFNAICLILRAILFEEQKLSEERENTKKNIKNYYKNLLLSTKELNQNNIPASVGLVYKQFIANGGTLGELGNTGKPLGFGELNEFITEISNLDITSSKNEDWIELSYPIIEPLFPFLFTETFFYYYAIFFASLVKDILNGTNFTRINLSTFNKNMGYFLKYFDEFTSLTDDCEEFLSDMAFFYYGDYLRVIDEPNEYSYIVNLDLAYAALSAFLKVDNHENNPNYGKVLYYIGLIYLNGNTEIEPDENKASYYFRLARTHGYGEEEYNMDTHDERTDQDKESTLNKAKNGVNDFTERTSEHSSNIKETVSKVNEVVSAIGATVSAIRDIFGAVSEISKFFMDSNDTILQHKAAMREHKVRSKEREADFLKRERKAQKKIDREQSRINRTKRK